MEDNVMDDVYIFLCGERVNVELLFRDDLDMGPLITCRLRPWKNQPHDGEMILAGGLDVDEAIFHAVRSLIKDEWLPLEWAQRARVPGRYVPGAQANFNQNDVRRTRLLSNELFKPNVIESKATPKNVSRNGLETHTETTPAPLKLRQPRP